MSHPPSRIDLRSMALGPNYAWDHPSAHDSAHSRCFMVPWKYVRFSDLRNAMAMRRASARQMVLIMDIFFIPLFSEMEAIPTIIMIHLSRE